MTTNPMQHIYAGAAYTMGFDPMQRGQTGPGLPRNWAAGPFEATIPSDGSFPTGQRVSFSTMNRGEMLNMGAVGVMGIGTTAATLAMGFSSGGVLGAASFLAQDVAISAAAVHHIPMVSQMGPRGLTSMAFDNQKVINAMIPQGMAAAPLRMGFSMIEGMVPYVKPVMGSAIGSMAGGLVAGPVGAFAGGMAGSHAFGASTRRAGAHTAMAGFKAAGRVAARHPLAGMAALGATVVGGAGYLAYKTAGAGIRIGAGVAQTALHRREMQSKIDTAGDLAAWSSRRAVSSGQMAHRNRQMLGMNMRQAFSATATKYHHAQRIF